MQDNRVKDALGYALVRAFRSVNRAHNRALKSFGISAEQAHILLVLWLEGPMKVGELQRILSLSSATLTGAVDRMQRSGLIRRAPDPDDGRAFRLEPGRVDRRRRRAIESTLETTEETCFGGLDKKEQRQLRALLDKVSESLRYTGLSSTTE